MGTNTEGVSPKNFGAAGDGVHDDSAAFSAMVDAAYGIERILCAAIHFHDGAEHVHQPVNIETGFVICGLRHPSCYGTLWAVSGPERLAFYRKYVQGFLTSANRFVGRREGLRIAESANQIANKHHPHDILMSEDLY